MEIQWDKSLYTTINSATQKKVNEVNVLAKLHFPKEYEGEWGTKTTLRAKINYFIELNGGP